jgi:predicted nucleic acid-binding protein
LEAALRLNLPLLTFDNKMIDIAKVLGVNILGGQNVGI